MFVVIGILLTVIGSVFCCSSGVSPENTVALSRAISTETYSIDIALGVVLVVIGVLMVIVGIKE